MIESSLGEDSAVRLGLGVVGLGIASELILPSILADGRFRIVAAADTQTPRLVEFGLRFDIPIHHSVESICQNDSVDAIYLATPNYLHYEHAVLILNAKKHLLIEKPLALTVSDCLEIDSLASKNGVSVVVGHTHAFDPVARQIVAIIGRGEFGKISMINTWNYGSFLFRQRSKRDLSPETGGGIIHNQVPHQVDVIRLLGGGLVRSVRSSVSRLGSGRGTEAGHVTFLEFVDGTPATMVFSGYDYFDTDEWQGWVGELGESREPGLHGLARRTMLQNEPCSRGEEVISNERLRAVQERVLGGSGGQAHFGVLVASCENGDLRWGPNGVLIYSENGIEERTLTKSEIFPDRLYVVDEFFRAAAMNEPVVHNARWGAATVEVCEAILRSADERSEVFVHHQVGSHPVSR